MSYHDLSECTLDADERREEATRIVSQLYNGARREKGMTDVEWAFICKMIEPSVPVSIKQLFWLRDLNNKY